jgi:hypothetical protein
MGPHKFFEGRVAGVCHVAGKSNARRARCKGVMRSSKLRFRD